MVHPSARVADGAALGPWCSVGPRCIVRGGCRLLQNVVVVRDTVLGTDSVVHPFTVLGGDPQDLKYVGESTSLLIGARNIIRESVSINRGTRSGGGVTSIGSGNLIMAHCHIGHDVQIGSDVVLGSHSCLAGHVAIGDGAWIGGQVSIAQRIKIGSHSYVPGHSGIDRHVPPFCIAFGNRPRGLYGANLVGLRRRFNRAEVRVIYQIVKIWMDHSFTASEAISAIEREHPQDRFAAVFVDFVSSCSSRVLR